MKKHHLISLIALTSIALAGCEWDSSKYDNFVADGNVTACPGEPKQAGNKYFPDVCNLIKIGNLYCGPKSQSGVDLIAVNDDGSIFCLNIESQGFNACQLDSENSEFIKKYSMEWKICQDYRQNGLFEDNNITTKCGNNEASSTLSELTSKENIFIGNIVFDGNTDKKYIDAREHGVCPSDYPVCHYDRELKKIGCIALIDCGDKKCDPRSEVCKMTDDNEYKCIVEEDKIDKCAGKTCLDTQYCDPNTGECTDKPVIDKCADSHCDEEAEYCVPDTGECKDINVIISDPCADLNCKEDTQYCKSKAGIYECADIALNPCESLYCKANEYCAQPDGVGGTWQCVANESCTNSCSSAAYSCLPDELAQLDPGNCGGCSAESDVHNCYKQYENANVSCENGQCKSSGCYNGFYQVGEHCYPYGFDDEHCTAALNCNDLSTLSGVDNWESAKCKKSFDASGKYDPANNKCVAASCKYGYHLYDDGNGAGCEKDSVSSCGSHGKVCEEIANSSDMICDYGKCKPICNSGFHEYVDALSNMSLCEADTIDNCGSHGSRCGETADSSNVTCDNGTCKPVCNSSFHEYHNHVSDVFECEENTLEHCGSHETVCTTASIANSITVSCSTGVCLPENCATGFHAYSNTCEVNDLSNCGAHEKSCEINDFTNATEVDCDAASGVCKATECENNYVVVGTTCENKTCEPNSVKCRNGLIYTCNSNNEWDVDNAVICPNNASCKSETECGVCMNGATKCEVSGEINAPVECQNGVWNNASCLVPQHATMSCIDDGVCSFECDENYEKSPDGKTCVEHVCDTDETRCVETLYQTCLYNSWSDGVICTAPEHATATCTNEGCGWNCDSTSNFSTKCGLECVDIQSDINNCGSCGELCSITYATSVICDNGSCVPSACGEGYCISGNSCVSKQTDMNNCGECGNICDTSKVNGASAVICVAGRCLATSCDPDCTFIPDKGTCDCSSISCTENSVQRCTNNDNVGIVSVCRDNRYVNEHCPNDYSCSASASGGGLSLCLSLETCCGECKNGVSSCENTKNGVGQLTTCSGGTKSTSSCDNGYSCNSSFTDCGVCQNGKKECDGEYAYKTCDKGAWGVESTPCPDNETCSDGVCSPSTGCTEGHVQSCSNDSSDKIGERRVCRSGEYIDETCPNDNSCNSSLTDCGACQNYQIDCNNTLGTPDKYYLECFGGAWINHECPENNVCDNNECTLCGNGIIDSGEECDIDNNNGHFCYDGGSIVCDYENNCIINAEESCSGGHSCTIPNCKSIESNRCSCTECGDGYHLKKKSNFNNEYDCEEDSITQCGNRIEANGNYATRDCIHVLNSNDNEHIQCVNGLCKLEEGATCQPSTNIAGYQNFSENECLNRGLYCVEEGSNWKAYICPAPSP